MFNLPDLTKIKKDGNSTGDYRPGQLNKTVNNGGPVTNYRRISPAHRVLKQSQKAVIIAKGCYQQQN